MNGQFVRGGCCILDFYLCWALQAVVAKEPDEAYKHSRQLAHCILGLVFPQRELFGEEFPSRYWQRR